MAGQHDEAVTAELSQARLEGKALFGQPRVDEIAPFAAGPEPGPPIAALVSKPRARIRAAASLSRAASSPYQSARANEPGAPSRTRDSRAKEGVSGAWSEKSPAIAVCGPFAVGESGRDRAARAVPRPEALAARARHGPSKPRAAGLADEAEEPMPASRREASRMSREYHVLAGELGVFPRLLDLLHLAVVLGLLLDLGHVHRHDLVVDQADLVVLEELVQHEGAFVDGQAHHADELLGPEVEGVGRPRP